MSDLKISSTEEIISEIRNGRMVILVDEEDRENEGDLVLAAQIRPRADLLNPHRSALPPARPHLHGG